MKYIQNVLVLTGKEKKTFFSKWSNHPFFPGSREKNYEELLQGSGIPYEIRLADELVPSDVLTEHEVRCSAIIFTLPFEEIRSELLFWIERASSEHGVTLISDTFLIQKNYFFHAFGLREVGKKRVAPRQVRNREGEFLYRRKHSPYAGNGFALGVRPFLRLFMQSWHCRTITPSENVAIEASYSSHLPAVISTFFGEANNWMLNFHPSRMLREGNGLHNLIQYAISTNKKSPFFSFDFDGMLCLRMDDPGSCERVHLEGYNPGVIKADDWKTLLKFIKEKHANLNIAYVPGWIDDGDKERGTLTYQGKEVEEREPGRLYHSWQTVYSRKGEANSHDYVSEYEVIKKGVEEGAFTILSHGLTHLTTHVDKWLKAKDRYTKMEWFREFREMAAGKKALHEAVMERMTQGKELIQQAFGIVPSILVPSAHEQTPEAIKMAKNAGFWLFSSKYATFLGGNEPKMNRKVLAFYPEEREDGLAFANAGYPACYVFHDYDVYRNGVVWLENEIDDLLKRNVRSFPSMELVSCLLNAHVLSTTENNIINVSIDFPVLPAVLNSGEMVLPFKVRGKVKTITVFGKQKVPKITKSGEFSCFSLPFSLISGNKLEITVEVESNGSVSLLGQKIEENGGRGEERGEG